MGTITSRIDDATRQSVSTAPLAVTVEVTTVIEAPLERVWAALVDTPSYPDWNPFVTQFSGELVAGDRVAVELSLPRRKPQAMRPRIVEVVDGDHFEWLGSVGVRGLFDGRHRFEVQPLDERRTRFVHRERLSGALVPLFRTMLTVNTPEAFVAMNEALARRVTSDEFKQQ